MIAEAGLKANVHNVTDLAANSPESTDATSAVRDELTACLSAGMEIVSVLPGWVELRVPSDLSAIPPFQKLITQLDADLPREVREAISYAFGEMLSNAVEYGGQLNPEKRVEVRWVRLKRAVICRIKDPGDGFDPTGLDHAAINNPNTDPIRHASVRESKGLRPGGFGILLTSQLVDELIYNDRHNEVLFLKYLS